MEYVVFQREGAEELFQFFETVADFRRIGFVRFCVGLVELIQDCFAITVAGIKGVSIYVRLQPLCDLIYVDIFLLSVT